MSPIEFYAVEWFELMPGGGTARADDPHAVEHKNVAEILRRGNAEFQQLYGGDA